MIIVTNLMSLIPDFKIHDLTKVEIKFFGHRNHNRKDLDSGLDIDIYFSFSSMTLRWRSTTSNRNRLLLTSIK